MKKRNFARAVPSLALFAAFALWTAAVCRVDVRAIGPGGSSVGFAAMNGWVHGLTGVHMALYTLTDWLGLVPLCFVLGLINCCAELNPALKKPCANCERCPPRRNSSYYVYSFFRLS